MIVLIYDVPFAFSRGFGPVCAFSPVTKIQRIRTYISVKSMVGTYGLLQDWFCVLVTGVEISRITFFVLQITVTLWCFLQS